MRMETKDLLKIVFSCGLNIFFVVIILTGLYYLSLYAYENKTIYFNIFDDIKQTISPVLIYLYENSLKVFLIWLAFLVWPVCITEKFDEQKYLHTAVKVRSLISYILNIGTIIYITMTITGIFIINYEASGFKIALLVMLTLLTLIFSLSTKDEIKEMKKTINKKNDTQNYEQLELFDNINNGDKK